MNKIGVDAVIIQDIGMASLIHKIYPDMETAILDVSIHYRDGSRKYQPRNWEKGINLSSYIDSGARHYLKVLRGDKDEPHHRAFLWNMLGALWTHANKPEMIDLPFKERSGDRGESVD